MAEVLGNDIQDQAVTKAVILSAGFGTRAGEAVAGVEKSILPIMGIPLIGRVVGDLALAGITDFCIVVGERPEQIQDYLEGYAPLENYLEANAKESPTDSKRMLLEKLQDNRRGLAFSYVQQPLDGPYGTAYPAWLAREFVEGDEAFMLATADDPIFRVDGSSEAQDLLDFRASKGKPNAMLVASLPAAQASGRYGTVETDENSFLTVFREAPVLPADAPEQAINVSKYIFNTNEFMPLLDKYMTEQRDGEAKLTDVIERIIAAGGRMAVKQVEGDYLDGGNPESLLQANITVFNATHPEAQWVLVPRGEKPAV